MKLSKGDRIEMTDEMKRRCGDRYPETGVVVGRYDEYDIKVLMDGEDDYRAAAEYYFNKI